MNSSLSFKIVHAFFNINIVTFLPFKNVYYMSLIIANQSKNKYVSVSL